MAEFRFHPRRLPLFTLPCRSGNTVFFAQQVQETSNHTVLKAPSLRLKGPSKNATWLPRNPPHSQSPILFTQSFPTTPLLVDGRNPLHPAFSNRSSRGHNPASLTSRRSLSDANVARNVGDVVPRVTVQALLQAALIEVVTNETNRTAEDKKAVQRSDLTERGGTRSDSVSNRGLCRPWLPRHRYCFASLHFTSLASSSP